MKIGNISYNPIVIERGDVLVIYDDILQRPVECFKPDKKMEDVPLNNIPQNLKVSEERMKIPTELS